MTDTIEYALMAGAAYESTRKDPNKIPSPDGWKKLDPQLWHTKNDASGFEAVAFVKDNTIVISYAGTYPEQKQDLVADGMLGTGILHPQLFESAKYYQDIKKAHPESEGFRYTFTGHSLGGGLAALMGVFFNKPAVTFDPAPFRKAATPENREKLIDWLAGNGYGIDKNLLTFSSTVINFDSLPDYPINIRGEGKISATAVAGEFLSIPVSERYRIRAGSTMMIPHGNKNQGGLNGPGLNIFHAQTLLIALKQSGAFMNATLVMPYLIPDLFDEKLFAVSADKPEQDLLSLLIRREFGVPKGASDTDLLTKFGQDMFALATSGTASQDIRQSLERIAFAYYYGKTEGHAEVFFEAVSGGLRFDLTGVALGNAQPAYDQLKTWIKSKAPSEAAEKLNQLDTYKRHTLGLGTSLTTTAPDDNQADFMLGGASGNTLDGKGGDDLLIGRDGNDTLKGGAGTDSLYGGKGNDTLEGGEGDDTLEGGAGHDTYIWSVGDGNDTIKDSDGQGHIEIRQSDGSSQILGGQLIKQENGDTWKSTDGQLTLVKGQGWTLTTQNGATLIFDQYKDGDFGLTQKAAPEKDKPTPTTQIGDKKSDGTAAPNQRDILMGSYGSADQLEGRGGNDILDGDQKGEFALSDDRLKGEKGNDILWGNEGRDILEGGEGKDWLEGGPGDDKLYADKESKPEDILKQTGKGGTPGDWLDGGEGDDPLIGDLDDDLLMGGHGKDILIGGGGNDTLVGGGGTRNASFLMPGKRTLANGQEEDILYPELEWTLKREIENGRTYKYTHDITKTTSFTALDFYKNGDDTQGDVLYGGGGEDWIYAGEGDDIRAANDHAWKTAA
jgi:Ca2+-binding RTX toxin-like protein